MKLPKGKTAAGKERVFMEDEIRTQAAKAQNQPEETKIQKHWKRNLLLFLLFLIAAGLGKRYFPSQKKMDLKTSYYKIGKEEDGALIVGNSNTEMGVKIEEESLYLPLEAVNTYINERFYWDGECILYTLPEETAEYVPGSTEFQIGEKRMSCEYVPVLLEKGQVWLDIRLIEQYTNITWNRQENPCRVWVWNCWEQDLTYAQTKYSLPVRYRGGVKSPIVARLMKEETVQVLDNSLKYWTKVQTEEGIIGYVWSRGLKEFYTETKHHSFEEPEYTSLSLGEKVILMWHQNLSGSGAEELPDILQNNKMNVIAPSWFTISDSDGQIINRAEKSYTDLAHDAGISVWAMLDNMNVEIDNYKLLSNTDNRRRLIGNVIQAALDSGVDGINVDLESIGEVCGPSFAQLIRELSAACRKEKLILSVDNYVPTGSSLYYNRDEQAAVADYIIMMGYDEHWAGSAPGSTASYSFVENGILRSLQEVPEEKLILAVPFYTRLWTIEGDLISSKAVGIKDIPQILSEWKTNVQWLEEERQHYAEVSQENIVQKLWIEDADSMAWKLELVKKYNLAGAAVWKAGMGTEEIWNLNWE